MSTRPGLARGGRRIRSTIELLAARDGTSCGRCSRSIDLARSGLDPDGPTLGHIVPAIAGGGDELANLRLEHRRCNLAAGSRPTPPRARIVAPIRIVD